MEFKHKVYAEVLLKNADGTVDNQAFAASTLKPVYEASQYQLAPITLQSYGKVDSSGLTSLTSAESVFYEQWNLTIGIHLPANKILHQIDVVAAFDYITKGDV